MSMDPIALAALAAAKKAQSGGVDPEVVAEATAAWLDEHVDPETGYVIDDSLTIEGAAADAKKVGDEMDALKSALIEIVVSGTALNITTGLTNGNEVSY